MSKSFLLESDIEDLALDTLKKVGYTIYKSPSPSLPSLEIDAMRQNDHATALLIDKLEQALRKLNPGYSEEIYHEVLRQLTRLSDNPDMMINNHYFYISFLLKEFV